MASSPGIAASSDRAGHTAINYLALPCWAFFRDSVFIYFGDILLIGGKFNFPFTCNTDGQVWRYQRFFTDLVHYQHLEQTSSSCKTGCCSSSCITGSSGARRWSSFWPLVESLNLRWSSLYSWRDILVRTCSRRAQWKTSTGELIGLRVNLLGATIPNLSDTFFTTSHTQVPHCLSSFPFCNLSLTINSNKQPGAASFLPDA
jgi:hypothetical protein